jgi:serine/threonine protein kinase
MIIVNIIQDYIINKFFLNNLFFQTKFSKLYKYNNLLIKEVPKKKMYKNEFNILKTLNNENIIKIDKTYEFNNKFYTTMKYYPCGDLHHNISNDIINVRDYYSVIHKLTNPIYYIHKNNIVHLDLKLENFLVDYDTHNFILIDFNVSRQHNLNYYDLQYIGQSCGTKYFMAPEVKQGYFCKSSDMYSLGCILYTTYNNEYYNNQEINLKDKRLNMLVTDLLNENHKYRPNIFDLKSFY